MFDKLFKKKKEVEKPVEIKDATAQFANALGSFILQMKELSDSDDGINVVMSDFLTRTRWLAELRNQNR